MDINYTEFFPNRPETFEIKTKFHVHHYVYKIFQYIDIH